MVTTSDFRLHPMAFPGAQIIPLEHNPLVTTLGFAPLSRSSAPVPGVLTTRVIAGGFKLNWQVSCCFTLENKSSSRLPEPRIYATCGAGLQFNSSRMCCPLPAFSTLSVLLVTVPKVSFFMKVSSQYH